MDRAVIDRLVGFAGRGACTDAERRAAAWLHDELRARGHEAWVESRWLRPQAAASLLLHTALAAAASLASVAVPLPAAIAAGVAAASLAVEASGRTGPLRLAFPRRATQHVLTAPAGEGVAVIVAARYDAPRAGAAARAPLRRAAARLPGRPLAWTAACAALVTVAALARVAGVSGAWLGAAQLVPTLVLLGALALAADRLAAPWAAGANDDASGVAVALELHDALCRRAPAGVAPAILLHGAGAPGPQALHAHLRGERLRRSDTVVLAVEPSGAGTPAWGARHRQLRAAASRASGGARPRLRPPAGAGRLPALAVGALDARGVAPPESIDPATLDAVLALAAASVAALAGDLVAR